ncbi:MAG TPA: SagB/ThcOx family dehydrogenase [Vicinamibacterales bacterium]
MIAVRYHDSTKHHFNRFARSVGYLDWATQPNPFRRYEGAPLRALPHEPLAGGVPYSALFTNGVPPQPITEHSIGEFLRCSMGLSAWKQYGQSRWALRVNPSSGNLHPTEAWIVHDGRVCHYAPREHALEERCVLQATVGQTFKVCPTDDCFLVALTSIIWREAWKYGERAFRYCQHDTGHAIGTLRLAASMLGWQLRLLTEWSDAQIAALLGLDRDADFERAEREEPECVAIVGPGPGSGIRDPKVLIEAARQGSWYGRANRLSSGTVDWPVIDDVTRATRYPGEPRAAEPRTPEPRTTEPRTPEPRTPGSRIPDPESRPPARAAREIIIQRRSALSFDPRGYLQRDAFLSMLQRLQPGASPWDAIDWPPHVHLVLFVHRVEDVTPGVYAYLRDPAVLDEWKAAMRPDFLWEAATDPRTLEPPTLFLLVPIDAGRIANRLSCDQDIAEEGFFGLAMMARFEQPLRERGEWFYRRLFWECGLIGQVLYLEAEAAGGRATGIGCYYDDPVHDLLGLSGHGWQGLYHFSMGLPVEDTRLTSEPGYPWEVRTR